MTAPKVYRSKPKEAEAIQWNPSDPNAEAAIDAWYGAKIFQRVNDCLILGEGEMLSPGDWLVKDSYGNFHVFTEQQFADSWTDDDHTSVAFRMKMIDGDEAVVTVEGFKQVATAARALIHCGSPDVVTKLIRSYAEQGDMSVIALANELGSLAEKKAGVHK